MSQARVEGIRRLLMGIQTGDPQAVSVISPTQYIQHNPQTHTGREGLAALFRRLAKTNPRVNLVRMFWDGDHVFGHTEYDFSTRRVGFEVFRFEGAHTVEHWDNIQPRQGPNSSGHSMVDGPTEARDLQLTESNRQLVRAFVQQVRIGGDLDQLDRFISPTQYTEHHPTGRDGRVALAALLAEGSDGEHTIQYKWLHRVLAQGDFVLTVCEGQHAGRHAAFYDLHRVQQGRIVERWNTTEHVAPIESWKHGNGKF